MIRLTKRVFVDLAIYMIGFGVLIGIFFPIFLSFLGVSASLVFAPWFFLICVMAGIIVLIADRIRRLVEETVFQHGSTFVSLTISGGASSWPDSDAASADAMVRKADEALYRAKDTGRNRIIAL